MSKLITHATINCTCEGGHEYVEKGKYSSSADNWPLTAGEVGDIKQHFMEAVAYKWVVMTNEGMMPSGLPTVTVTQPAEVAAMSGLADDLQFTWAELQVEIDKVNL